MNLNLRPKEECKFDAVSLGEVMLRLDPGEGSKTKSTSSEVLFVLETKFALTGK